MINNPEGVSDMIDIFIKHKSFSNNFLIFICEMNKTQKKNVRILWLNHLPIEMIVLYLNFIHKKKFDYFNLDQIEV